MQEVKSAIEVVFQGGTFYSQELIQNMLKNLKQAKISRVNQAEFSVRESEIMHLI